MCVGRAGRVPGPSQPRHTVGACEGTPWELPRVLLKGLSLLGAFDRLLVPRGVLTLPRVEAAAGTGCGGPAVVPIKALVLSSCAGSSGRLEGTCLLQERRTTRMTK